MIGIKIRNCYISAAVIGVAIFLHGLPAKAAEPQSTEPGQSVDAAALYTEHCAICHGDSGDANTRAQNGLRPPPRDFTTVAAALELTRERMIDSVTNGRPGTAMMPHKDRLSEAQIAALVDYIRANFMRTPTQIQASPADEAHEQGEEIYGRFCSVCHGDKGNTAVWARSGLNPPPRNFTSVQAKSELTRERMIQSVTNGRPGTGMMPFTSKLNTREIEAVVDYIRYSFMKVDANNQPLAQSHPDTGGETSASDPHAQPQIEMADNGEAQRRALMAHAHQAMNQRRQAAAAVQDPHQNTPQNPHQGPHQGGMPMAMAQSAPIVDADMTLPLPNGLQGDVEWGRKFFMSNCFTCHGVTGEGNGPRAHFNIPRPRNFTSDESRRVLNRVRIYNSITHGKVGTVMPAWGKVLDEQQIANVAEFVFEAFVRPEDYPQVSSIIGETGTSANGEKKKAP
jgi:mono/diheme cytochrome c family protein